MSSVGPLGVRPCLRRIHCAPPAGETRLDLRRAHGRLEAPFQLPLRLEFVDIVPVADGEPRQIGRAERRRFRDARARNLDAENVSLELHQQIVRASAAVDAQFRDAHARVRFHGLQHVHGLMSRAPRARDVQTWCRA